MLKREEPDRIEVWAVDPALVNRVVITGTRSVPPNNASNPPSWFLVVLVLFTCITTRRTMMFKISSAAEDPLKCILLLVDVGDFGGVKLPSK